VEKKNYIVAIDLGSSNVVVAVAERDAEGRPVVRSIVSKPSQGVKAGMITNIEQVSNSIKAAVEAVGEELGIRITEAYTGISGDFVRCARHTDHVFTSDPQNGVNRTDVEALFDRMRNVQAPDDETIMERIPQNYLVDENQEVADPVGSFGKRLASTFNFILCAKTPIERLNLALRRLGIRSLGMYANALVTGAAVLSADEKEEGAAVVNIGGGVTDVAVYYRNVPRYIATIPMGAGAINNDIRTLGILERHVDSLKRKFGSAVAELAPENKMVSVKGRTAKETKDILLHNLAVVIESRARDIAEYVAQEIRDSGFGDKLAYGIVLTGGSAQLQHIDELFRRVTGMEVRIGTAEEAVDETSREKVASPAYSTAVGLLLRGAAHGDCAVTDIPRQGGAAQSAGPTIPRATPYSARKPATGVSAAPYTPRPAAAPTPPPTTPAATTPAANAATEGAAQGAAAETAETPHRPKRGLLDKLKQKLGTRLDDFFTGSEDEEI
jgi:cell division protein FtsA